ncbi:hypothetical protein ACFQ1I_00135 [Kitasatospora arboriphila]
MAVPVLAFAATLAVPGASGLRDLVGLDPADGRHPATQPSGYGMDQLDQVQARLHAALAAHLPPGYTAVLTGASPTTFRLARADGGYTTIAAIMGTPCRPAATPPHPANRTTASPSTPPTAPSTPSPTAPPAGSTNPPPTHSPNSPSSPPKAKPPDSEHSPSPTHPKARPANHNPPNP